MKNAAYWRGRFAILEQQAHALADDTIREMEKAYLEAALSVRRDLEAWYLRFAKNNEMSLSNARKLLNSRELEEFKWTVEKYVEKGESLDPKWAKKLENASCKFHISRLEAIELEIQQQIEVLFGNQVDALDALLTEIVGDGYTRTAYEIQKGLGVGWNITKPDEKVISTLLTKPWTTDMRTFRDRCWVNKEALVDSVHKKLTQAILRGDSPAKTTAAIEKEFSVSKYKARRLVHTETSYFRARSSLMSYQELGVEQVEVLETLDSRTCPICGGMDGKVIPIGQVEPGVTVPPYHPNCRGTTVPYFEDMKEGKRAARGADGKTYYVPEGMTYEEWKRGFVEGGEKTLTNAAGHPIIQVEKVTLTGEPNSITQKTYKNGGIDRNYYGADGKQTKQISNHDHGHKKESGFGEHGEHGHDYIWLEDSTFIRDKARELTVQEREENGDVLNGGRNQKQDS